jgi:hypothetical protein
MRLLLLCWTRGTCLLPGHHLRLLALLAAER